MSKGRICDYETTYKNRPYSRLVCRMMDKGKKDRSEIAEYIGHSIAYFNNKLNRGSFSLDELVTIANACGYYVLFTNSKDKVALADYYWTQVDIDQMATVGKETI